MGQVTRARFDLYLMLIEELQTQAKQDLDLAIRRRESAQRLFNFPRPQIPRDKLIKAIAQHELAWARYDALTYLRGKKVTG
jgi:hypothetical protein